MRRRPAEGGLFSLPSLALGVLLVAGGLVAGCATSRDPATARYRAAQNEMVYRARDISLGTLFPTGGLSRDPIVEMSTWATCSGEGCRPQEVWLSFSIRRSPSRVLSHRDVKMKTDTEVYTWTQQNRRSSGWNTQSPKSGEITRLSMELSTFRDIAESRRLSGTLGGEPFSLSYEKRAPLRAMANKMRGANRGRPPS